MIRFIVVPVEIWAMTDLQPGQRMLLALIQGFTENGKGCTMSNEAIGDVLQVSGRTARRWLGQLKEMGHIDITQQGGHRVAIRVATAMAGGGGHGYGQQGGHSSVHHIRKERKDDNITYQDDMMNEPSIDQVTDYLMATPRVQECGIKRPELKRVASDALTYYQGTQWRTKRGEKITQWRPVMAAWMKRALADYRPPQQRPRKTADELRRSIAWHTRRMVHYADTDRQHLAHSEQQAINALRAELKQQGHA